MKKDIIIKYTSHHNNIIPWLDEAIKAEMKKKDYFFIGSGFTFHTAERDMQFRWSNISEMSSTSKGK